MKKTFSAVSILLFGLALTTAACGKDKKPATTDPMAAEPAKTEPAKTDPPAGDPKAEEKPKEEAAKGGW